MSRSHLYKKQEAADRAKAAHVCMQTAMGSLEAAEHHLNLSGYKGAARGVHQANERVKSWIEKVNLELGIARQGGAK